MSGFIVQAQADVAKSKGSSACCRATLNPGLCSAALPSPPCLRAVNAVLVSTFPSAGARKHRLLRDPPDSKRGPQEHPSLLSSSR